MITAFRRVVKAGFVGFWRNAYVSLTSIFVLTIALFMIGATMFVNQLLQTSLVTLQEKVDINVYFMPDAPQEEIDRVIQAVEALPDVSAVTYTSREDALAKYRADNQDDAVAMQALAELDANPLGANIAILAKQTSQYESIARFLEEQQALEQPQTPVIDNFNYTRNRDSIDRLTSIIEATNQASLFIMGFLLLASILITFNTIRLAIYTSREEIAIMRLVGAGNMYIRGPFMLQGIMYGFVSGVVALAFYYPMLIWLGPATAEFFGVDLYQYYIVNFGEIFGVLVGIGILMGLISSTLAVARYLRT